MPFPTPLLGAVEAGGTKFVCAVGTGPSDIRATTRIATTTPDETLGRVIEFFRGHESVAALGVGAFGPLDLCTDSPTFGFITSTPKVGWRDCNIVGTLRGALRIPVVIDTDVNAAAIGEHRWGAARDVEHVLYMTVGTGIGGGVLVQGAPLHGAQHPEIGHMPVPHDRSRDAYAGCCPFHGDCLEGLASGPALHARWGRPGETLPDDHPAWPLEAHYLALSLVTCIYTLAPERIILGGGVMQRTHLFPLVRAEVNALINGYVTTPVLDELIVPPALGNDAGMLGALALAERALADAAKRDTI
ncbi:MAG: ROK family protein [bacterium]